MDNTFLSRAIREMTGKDFTPLFIEFRLQKAGITPATHTAPTEAKPGPDGGMSIKEALAIAQRLKDQLAGKGLDSSKMPTFEAVEALGVICRHLEQRIPARK